MNVEKLRSHLNREVRLSFKDGEIVDAVLLGVDPDWERDLTYEVKHVVQQGSPLPRGTAVGAPCIAQLDDLSAWEPIGV